MSYSQNARKVSGWVRRNSRSDPGRDAVYSYDEEAYGGGMGWGVGVDVDMRRKTRDLRVAQIG